MADGIVVTTFKAGDALGDRAVRGFEEHWPCEVRVVHDPRLLDVPEPPLPLIGGKKRNRHFRRYLHKASLIASLAELGAGHRYAYWVDADVVTLKDIPAGFLPGLFLGHPLVFLGRVRYTTETGFIGFDLEARATAEFLATYRAIYESGAVYELEGWWDNHVFDAAREQLGLLERNLSPGWVGGGHPWCASPLAEYTDHLKGPRKEAGFSPEHPLQRGVPWPT